MRKLWIRRKAVSSIIGGIIVLFLFLMALTAMVIVSQQNDAYQSMASKMSQKDIDRFTENLIADYPGLTLEPTNVSCTGVSGQCNVYDMTVSNVGGLSNAGNVGGSTGVSAGAGGGGVGIQLARLYVNSTGSTGCSPPSGPCILNPDSAWFSGTPTAYTFRDSDAFVNAGEFNHTVHFYLPTSIGPLPGAGTATPKNTVWMVTARGRVFSMQWPFPPAGISQSGAATGTSINTGIMKIAYQGTYDSKHEGAGASGSTYPNAPYCHGEPQGTGPDTAETLTGITGVTGGSLTFINPWITDMITKEIKNSRAQLYIYAKILYPNSASSPLQFNQPSGAIGLEALSGSQIWKLDGALFGIYIPSGSNIGFYCESSACGSSVTVPPIQPGQNYYALFCPSCSGLGYAFDWPGGPSFYFGYASVSSLSLDSSYFSGSILLDGLWERTSCAAP